MRRQPGGDRHLGTARSAAGPVARAGASLAAHVDGGGLGAAGEGKYMINRYLRERGDANIKSNADLIAKATVLPGPELPGPQAGTRAGRARNRARYRGSAAGAFRAADDADAVHAGAAARCARVADVYRAAAQADVAPRAGVQRTHADRVVADRPAGISGDHVPAGFTTERVGSRRATATTRASSDRLQRRFRSASISSRARSTNRCCSASPQPMKRRPSTARCPLNSEPSLSGSRTSGLIGPHHLNRTSEIHGTRRQQRRYDA